MLKYLIIAILSAASLHLYSQAIDGSFPFQTDPDKKYSIYIPTTYDEATPNSMMIGLHPLNVNRWDAQAWRDTLVVFAESNDLILVCPDGGGDGRVDDAIDTAFTSILVDSMEIWYNINPEEKYLMGFSWGGKTAYTYGLRRTEEFSGSLIIGPAVTLNEVADVISNAEDESFYLVHGSQDSPNVRYTPLLESLQSLGGCVETQLLSGVGHTIDFPDRNNILSTAFQWLQTQVCEESKTSELSEEIMLSPNPFKDWLEIDNISQYELKLSDINQNNINYKVSGNRVFPDEQFSGLLFITLTKEKKSATRRILKL